MEWGPNPRLMCTITGDGVNVCRKSMLKQCFRDGLVAIQVCPHA